MSQDLYAVLRLELMAIAIWCLFVVWVRVMVKASPAMRLDEQAAALRRLEMKRACLELALVAVDVQMMLETSRHKGKSEVRP